MLGSPGPRMMRIGLPHVDLWNTWWSDYGNSVPGFESMRGRVEDAAAQAGRQPGEVGATAAVLVRFAQGRGRIMGEGDYNVQVEPVPGAPTAIAEHVAAMGAAGAVHVQLVLDPITIDSILEVGKAVALL